MRWRPGYAWGLLLLVFAGCGGGGGGDAGGGSAGASTNSISLGTSQLSLVYSGGSTATAQTVQVSFRGAGVVVATLPGQTQPAWLSVSAGASSSSNAAIVISADPSGLGPGSYSTTLRFATGDADGTHVVTRDLPVTFTYVHTVSPDAVDTTGVAGGAAQATTLTVVAGNIRWTASANVPWITLDRSSGTGTSAIVVTAAPAAMAVGDYTGSISIVDDASRAVRSVPVSFGVDPHRLVVRRPGVALSQVGVQSRLSTQITVSDNGAVVTAWSASSDQPWLALDKTQGSTETSLGLSASTAGLPDGMHYARVTISPRNEPSVANIVVVRVGLYVDRAALFVPNVTAAARVVPASPHFTFGFVADPIRPFFYHAQGDGQIDVVNAYTGATVGSVSIPGAALGAMAASADGSRLYAADIVGQRIFPIDLDSRVAAAPLPASLPNDMSNIAYAEVNGRAVLLTSAFQAIDATSASRLAEFVPDSVIATYGAFPAVAAQHDGRAFFVQAALNGNHSLARYSLSDRNGVFRVKRTHEISVSGNGAGLAVAYDDTRVYAAAANAFDPVVGSFGGYGYAAATLVELGRFGSASSAATGIVASPAGSIYVSESSGSSVVTYQPSFAQSARYAFDERVDRVALSGDAHRVGLYVQSGMRRLLHFTDVP